MEKAAPVTTLCGQLAALETQTFHVKRREKQKAAKVFHGNDLVTTAAAPGENASLLPRLLARPAPGDYNWPIQKSDAARAAMTAALPESG